VTGCAIVDAIIGGLHDPEQLAQLREPNIKASAEVIRKSLLGNWRSEHLFTLQQSRQMYRLYQEQIYACNQEIEKLITAFQPQVDPLERPLPPDRKKRQRRKATAVNPTTGFDARTESYKLFGVDLTQIPGLMSMPLVLFSEVGRDMSRWPTAAHFASWLGLCPDNDISGGRVLWRGMRRVHNRAGHLFRMAAHSLHHAQTPMGHHLRRLKGKIGPAAATTATAHKIAIVFYAMVKHQTE
jgi:transposase